MHRPFRIIGAALCLLTAAACALPRGAAVDSEVTRNQNAADANFSVIPVGRDNVERLRTWPVTGWKGHYTWFQSRRGPKSNLIQTGDRVELVIWDNQDTSLLTTATEKNVVMNNLVVSPDGSIFVPYIDAVQVRSKTPEEARDEIEMRLADVIPSVQVQIEVTSGPDNSVDAVRGFKNPGSYPLPNRNYSLLSLISAAGGISDSLENPLVRLIRNSQSYEIRADRLFEEPSANVVLRGGDKIIVEEDDRYFVALGATGTETLVPFFQDNITAIEALSLLGGLVDERANPQGVLILREYNADQVRLDGTGPDKQQVVFAVDLTSADGLFAANKFRVHPRDLVMATESPVTNARTVLGLLGTTLGLGIVINNNI